MLKATLSKAAAGLILASALATSAFASGSHPTLYIGSTTIDSHDSATAFGFGVDMIKGFDSGVEAGMDINILYASIGDGYDTSTNAGLDLIIGYNFDKKLQVPIAVKAGLGYGFGKIGNSVTMKGPQYSAAVEWDITSKLGIGVKYLYQDFTASYIFADADLPIDNYLGYVYYKFKATK